MGFQLDQENEDQFLFVQFLLLKVSIQIPFELRLSSCGQTLLLRPCNDNKLQNLAISSTPSSTKLGIGLGDGKTKALNCSERAEFEDDSCR